MPEPTLCPQCGGVHTGPCLPKEEKSKEERILTPEEKNQQERWREGLGSYLSYGQIVDAQKIINFAESKKISLDLAKPEIVSVCQKGLEFCLASRGWIYDAPNIISFAESKGISLDIASACQKTIEQPLLNNNLDQALKINNLSPLSPEKAFALYSHHLEQLLTQLQSSAPQILVQAQKSPDLFFSLFAFRENPEQLITVLKENPFLSNALMENPRFGSKLLVKYPKFDHISRAKISFLYQSKQEILKDHPNWNQQSYEFRQAMQAKLTGFAKNQEIVQQNRQAGLDTEKFLNYEETEYFKLASGEELVPFSERILTPINRLSETIASYAYQIKNVLSQYRQDLRELKALPKSAEEAKARIREMEQELAKAKEEENEKKVQGLARGLEGMRQKLARIQPQPLWDRITDEIAGFTKLKESLASFQQTLLDKEKRYFEISSEKAVSGEKMLQAKGDLAKAKEQFKNELSVLERRVASFKENLASLLEPLGKDRAMALIQEINERTAEQFFHFDSDRTTLANLFSERADKEKEKLEDRPMSIFVWARNPDIDLYQGNYSPCCICIESAHMGEESTIADYATDLGIQIVNVWDETKNEPVAAAWCWTGIDENGQTALVVDNIEANTLYSSNFPQEITEKLFDYLKQYAKAIKADYLVLGKSNNDLPTASEMAKLPEAGAAYTKIGGYNQRPDGYFLEAEEAAVKLLWEKQKKAKEEEKKEKRPPLEIKGVQTNPLTKDDFQKVIDLEEEVYEEGLARGWQMIEDLKKNKGEDYSVIVFGQRPGKEQAELLGYLVAYEDETDGGKPCVYLDDIALASDCQGTGLGWRLLKGAIDRLKIKAQEQSRPILFDMHLKPGSQRLFEKHETDLRESGVTLRESALVPDYYDDGEDALYCVYEVKTG